ncbi:NYN domain-containing protein [bacterium]|nr:NYN domain-containing protein [bacterium]
MGRLYIVDAYNLMHQMPSIKKMMDSDLQRSRELLINMLSSFVGKRRIKLTLVFDGVGGIGHPTTPASGMKIIFSRNGEKADPLIKRLVDRLDQPRLCTVVTSDNEIVRYVRQYGCKIISSNIFFGQLHATQADTTNDPGADEKPVIDKNDVNDLLTMFTHATQDE